jgi:hypothetical protein
MLASARSEWIVSHSEKGMGPLVGRYPQVGLPFGNRREPNSTGRGRAGLRLPRRPNPRSSTALETAA